MPGSSRGLVLVAPRAASPFANGAFVTGSGSARGLSLDAAMSGSRYGVTASYGWQRVRLAYGDSSFAPGYGTSHLVEAGLVVFPASTMSIRLGLAGALGRRGSGLLGAFEWESCNLLDQGCEFVGSPGHDTGSLGRVRLPSYLRLDARRPPALAPGARRARRRAGHLRHRHQSPRPAKRAGAGHRSGDRKKDCDRDAPPRAPGRWSGLEVLTATRRVTFQDLGLLQLPGRHGACALNRRRSMTASWSCSTRTIHRLARYLDRLSGDRELAADLAQETFVKLYQRGALPDQPEAWLISVAMNLFRNARSTATRRRRLLTASRAECVDGRPAARTGAGSRNLGLA